MDTALRDAVALDSIKHENVVKLCGIAIDGDNLLSVMELSNGMSAWKYFLQMGKQDKIPK